jgi:hypothetical protein
MLFTNKKEYTSYDIAYGEFNLCGHHQLSSHSSIEKTEVRQSIETSFTINKREF